MTSYSLDTDTVSQLLKKHRGNQRVLDRFRREIRRNALFILCPVVFYEIRRELVIKNAVAQLTALGRSDGLERVQRGNLGTGIKPVGCPAIKGPLPSRC